MTATAMEKVDFEAEGLKEGPTLYLTSEWGMDRLLPYGPMAAAALRKLVEMYPEGSTMQSLANDIRDGGLQLWLMLDGEEFKGVVLTEVKSVDATGHKTVIVTGCAGVDGVELSPHIHQIEQWAWEQGADSVMPAGRVGWKKPLEKLGYHIDRVIYRKDKPNG